ncbi:MAG: hypothetical protein EBR82_68985 [Caulobacteraceae bacterium]|nr:hypothetical protein [Caulobacteraceae bacterium]
MNLTPEEILQTAFWESDIGEDVSVINARRNAVTVGVRPYMNVVLQPTKKSYDRDTAWFSNKYGEVEPDHYEYVGVGLVGIAGQLYDIAEQLAAKLSFAEAKIAKLEGR